jgi:hypothetical protein
MRIDSPNVSNLTFQAGAEVGDSQFTGSFTGSFTGVGNFEGLTADSVAYANVTGKPTLISSSAQVSITESQISDLGTYSTATGVENNADVTDTANVTAAGALMDSEVTNLAQVKSFDASDYATAAQGTTADSAQQPPLEGAFVDGDKTKLNGIEASADVTDTANVKTALNASLGGAASIGDSSDTITIPGNLTVTGTRTELQVANLNVEDLNITVASGSADSAAADGAGLTVDGAGATFTYSHSGTKWNLNKSLNVTGDITLSGTVDGIDIATDVAANTAKNTNVSTNLSKTTAADQITINSSDGDNVVIGEATATIAGLMSTTHHDKLDGIESGATADQTLADLNLDTTDDVQFDSFGVGTAASGTTGEIRATGDITAFYSSDERLKENFAPLTGALDKVKAIGGYEFDWKDGIEDVVSKTGHDIGVKAQELQAQYPELVHERDNGYLAVDYIKLNAVLIEAVKELSAKVDELSK